jgi:hypothetical protein
MENISSIDYKTFEEDLSLSDKCKNFIKKTFDKIFEKKEVSILEDKDIFFNILDICFQIQNKLKKNQELTEEERDFFNLALGVNYNEEIAEDDVLTIKSIFNQSGVILSNSNISDNDLKNNLSPLPEEDPEDYKKIKEISEKAIQSYLIKYFYTKNSKFNNIFNDDIKNIFIEKQTKFFTTAEIPDRLDSLHEETLNSITPFIRKKILETTKNLYFSNKYPKSQELVFEVLKQLKKDKKFEEELGKITFNTIKKFITETLNPISLKDTRDKVIDLLEISPEIIKIQNLEIIKNKLKFFENHNFLEKNPKIIKVLEELSPPQNFLQVYKLIACYILQVQGKNIPEEILLEKLEKRGSLIITHLQNTVYNPETLNDLIEEIFFPEEEKLENYFTATDIKEEFEEAENFDFYNIPSETGEIPNLEDLI